MQQDKNDIENQLRQLENKQLPDLSEMDRHWENMKGLLQPPVSTQTAMNKWFKGLGLLILISIIIFFITRFDEGKKQTVFPVKETGQQAIESPALTSNATGITRSSYPGVTKITSEKNKQDNNDIDKTFIDLPVQLNRKDSSLISIAPGRQKILNELLAELAKTSEQFIINNSRDTLLEAAEGSSLFIPANSLGGSGEVKISLREFYKTADIVLNKLSTTSNGQQLITGGMVHISATINDKPVNILPGKQMKLYMPDTSMQMEQMQLFTGEVMNTGSVNWKNSGQNFSRSGLETETEIWVLDTRNMPLKTIERKKGIVAIFAIGPRHQLSRSKLRDLLKQKYGYHKVRFVSRGNKKFRFLGGDLSGITYSNFPIGDSTWVEKSEVEKYKLEGTRSRTYQVTTTTKQITPKKSILRRSYTEINKGDTLSAALQNGVIEIQNKYSVDISSLGWINCDRFYKDRREKINYIVNLHDSAANFYTMLVFDKIRSMMAGHPSGNKIYFDNVPLGESVKIVSIGIGQNGEVLMAMKETRISRNEFGELQFETASANTIKSSLTQIDKKP